jgi:hypothetical protein
MMNETQFPKARRKSEKIEQRTDGTSRRQRASWKI